MGKGARRARPTLGFGKAAYFLTVRRSKALRIGPGNGTGF